MDSSDDLLGEAHDRMFEGDYEGVVESAKKAS